MASSSQAQRLAAFHTALGRDEIDLDEIRALMTAGLPEGGHQINGQSVKGLRSVCWKLLLGYLPTRRADWQSYLHVQRSNFRAFYREFMGLKFPFSPVATAKSSDSHAFDFDMDHATAQQPLVDVELHTSAPATQPPALINVDGYPIKSDDDRLKEDIRKDITRTLSMMHFFVSSSDGAKISDKQLALERVLYIFGKLNAGVRYVQGMNEILAPIFYTFFTDPCPSMTFEDPQTESFCSDIEADAFYCLNVIMSEIRDWFVPSADTTRHGIHRHVEWMDSTIKFFDPQLHAHLEELEVLPSYYSFRWLTTLLAREFLLPDVQRIWDSLFSDVQRFQLVVFFGVAMVTMVREELLQAEFVDCVSILQNFPSSDVVPILKRANELRKRLIRHYNQVQHRLQQQQEEAYESALLDAAPTEPEIAPEANVATQISAEPGASVPVADIPVETEVKSVPSEIPSEIETPDTGSSEGEQTRSPLSVNVEDALDSVDSVSITPAADQDSEILADPSIRDVAVATETQSVDSLFPPNVALFSTLSVPSAFSATPAPVPAGGLSRLLESPSKQPWYLKYEYSADGSEIVTAVEQPKPKSKTQSILKAMKTSLGSIVSYLDSPPASPRKGNLADLLDFVDIEADKPASVDHVAPQGTGKRVSIFESLFTPKSKASAPEVPPPIEVEGGAYESLAVGTSSPAASLTSPNGNASPSFFEKLIKSTKNEGGRSAFSFLSSDSHVEKPEPKADVVDVSESADGQHTSQTNSTLAEKENSSGLNQFVSAWSSAFSLSDSDEPPTASPVRIRAKSEAPAPHQATPQTKRSMSLFDKFSLSMANFFSETKAPRPKPVATVSESSESL